MHSWCVAADCSQNSSDTMILLKFLKDSETLQPISVALLSVVFHSSMWIRLSASSIAKNTIRLFQTDREPCRSLHLILNQPMCSHSVFGNQNVKLVFSKRMMLTWVDITSLIRYILHRHNQWGLETMYLPVMKHDCSGCMIVYRWTLYSKNLALLL